MAKPRLFQGPARSSDPREIIREFGDSYGHGGLLRIVLTDDTDRPVRVDVYRTEGEVSVIAAPADIVAGIGEGDVAELIRLLLAKFSPAGETRPSQHDEAAEKIPAPLLSLLAVSLQKAHIEQHARRRELAQARAAGLLDAVALLLGTDRPGAGEVVDALLRGTPMQEHQARIDGLLYGLSGPLPAPHSTQYLINNPDIKGD